MPFTDAERRDWHADRRAGRHVEESDQDVPREICGHCGNPFRSGEGVVTEEFAICDVCNGD